MSVLDVNCDLVRRTLVGFIGQEIGKFGCRCAIVGMSGGLDSTLSTFVATEALGTACVTGVIMPYRTSSPQSQADAELAAGQLGIETLVVDISPQIDAYFERFPDASQRRRGNKMARERMTILYDLSLDRDAMVVGTSNKSEILLGYTTLWGDMASAVNPLGDLYKTQVRQLARSMGVPEGILAKQPTADLWTGQTDEGELGFTYDAVDEVLFHLVDKRMEREEVIAAGFDATFVERVYRMVRDSQYKRRMPIIAKISQRSVDRDFRYSRDWGR
jgi:NAD+ synthase